MHDGAGDPRLAYFVQIILLQNHKIYKKILKSAQKKSQFHLNIFVILMN